MKLVIDTNVIISAFLKPKGNPGIILAAILNEQFELLYDSRIYSEYKKVLSRPKFGINETRIKDVLEFIEYNGELTLNMALPSSISLLIHEEDLHMAEIAYSGTADYLITGNKKHFPENIGKTKVIPPADFVKENI